MVQNLSWIIKCQEDITVFESGEWHDLFRKAIWSCLENGLEENKSGRKETTLQALATHCMGEDDGLDLDGSNRDRNVQIMVLAGREAVASLEKKEEIRMELGVWI